MEVINWTAGTGSCLPTCHPELAVAKPSPSGAFLPMAEALPLLHAIREQPEDDLLRLILADWLEDHGDARADLIRVDRFAQRIAQKTRGT